MLHELSAPNFNGLKQQKFKTFLFFAHVTHPLDGQKSSTNLSHSGPQAARAATILNTAGENREFWRVPTWQTLAQTHDASTHKAHDWN